VVAEEVLAQVELDYLEQRQRGVRLDLRLRFRDVFLFFLLHFFLLGTVHG
jgi:hypothetical protein